jgi:hypothetical protein
MDKARNPNFSLALNSTTSKVDYHTACLDLAFIAAPLYLYEALRFHGDCYYLLNPASESITTIKDRYFLALTAVGKH